MEITVSVELLNGVLQYLGNRPYAEVAGLVKAIQEAAQPQVDAAAQAMADAAGNDPIAQEAA